MGAGQGKAPAPRHTPSSLSTCSTGTPVPRSHPTTESHQGHGPDPALASALPGAGHRALGRRGGGPAPQGCPRLRLPLCGLCPHSGTKGHKHPGAPPSVAHATSGQGGPGGPGRGRRRSGGAPGCSPLCRAALPGLWVWPARRRPPWRSSAAAAAPSPPHPVAWTTRDHTASRQPSEAPHPHVADPAERLPLPSRLAPGPRELTALAPQGWAQAQEDPTGSCPPT